MGHIPQEIGVCDLIVDYRCLGLKVKSFQNWGFQIFFILEGGLVFQSHLGSGALKEGSNK